MAQTYKKTGTCSATVAQAKYPMYLWVGESAGSPAIFPSQGMVLNYPTAHSDTYVKATSKYSTAYWPHYATDPSLSLVAGTNNNAWRADAPTNQRLHIDLGSAKVVKGIYYENGHTYGSQTNFGAKNFIMQGSAESTAFAELTYATDTDWTQIGESMQFAQHTGSNAADPKYIGIANSTAYRYIALKIADNWGGACIDIRNITILTDNGFVHCSGHCQDDFGDIRFHNATDAALNYMIDWPTLQGTTPNQSVGVWVAPSPGTSDTDVVLKYGDSSLTDASDSSIFDKYEGFEWGSDNDNIPATNGGTVTWSDQTYDGLISTEQAYGGTRSAELTYSGNATQSIISTSLTAGTGYAIRYRIRRTDDNAAVCCLLHGNDTYRVAPHIGDHTSANKNVVFSYDGTYNDTGLTVNMDAWNLIEFRDFDWTNHTFTIAVNGVEATAQPMQTSAASENLMLFRGCNLNTGGSGTRNTWYDDVIVRKYASPEPTWGTWGAEEEISSGSNADISCGIASLVISAVADFDIVAPIDISCGIASLVISAVADFDIVAPIDISCGVAALGISASADFSIVAPGPVTATLSQAFREAVAKKEIDFLNDTFKIILMGADFEYDPETHGTLADVTSEQLPTGYGYTQDSKTLTGVAGEFNYDGYYSVTWDDASWTANGWPIGPTSAAIIYDYTHADQVVAYALQFGENRTVHNGFNLKIMGLEVIL